MSSSITARHGFVASSAADRAARRVVPVSLLLLLATACDPLSCQGRVNTLGRISVEDVAIITPFCPANAVTFNGDIDITTQAQLNAVTGCQNINGSIIIHDSTDIVDLAALEGLVEVRAGYILALNNSALTDISLPALKILESGIAAIDNPLLTKVLLPGLPVIGGDITLRNSPLLSKIDFSNIARVDNADFLIDNVAFVNVSIGNVILADLPALTTLAGAFSKLEIIEGFLDVQGTGLTSFAGLEALQEIQNSGGAATVRTKFRADALNPGLLVGIDFDDKLNVVANGNPALKNFAGLDSLKVIVGDVFVGFNDTLKNFDGLKDLATINGNFFVVGNESLEDFTGLEGDGGNDGDGDGLSAINGSLFIGLFFDSLNQPIAGGNGDFTDFSGLEVLTTITGDLVVAFNGSFESFNGLKKLATLGGDLVILGCEPDSFAGAKLLTTIGGDLSFGQFLGNDGQPMNPDEVNVTRQFVDINGERKNPGVKFDSNNGANGFEKVVAVGGDLIVAFSNFDDLRLSNPGTAVLANVAGSLVIYGNENPNSLEGIDGLTSLGGFVVNFAVDAFGDLKPFENDGLADFSDLSATNLGAGGLHIGFNSDLNDAAFATFPNFGNIVGDVTLARVINQNNLGPTTLADFNVTTIGGNLTLCAIKNGDSQPINADLGKLTTLNINATTTIDGDVFIGFCSNLVTTTFTVQDIGGALEFTALPKLKDINGMAQLNTAGEVLLHDLPALKTISIPGLTDIAANLEIVANPQLTAVDFNLNSVDGTIRLVDLADLADLNGLAGLNTVGADLDLIDLPQLENTNALNSLDSVVGTLRLRRLNNITNQAQVGGQQDLSFNSLTSVGSIEITEMNGLQDLAGLQSLATASGSVLIGRNPSLKTLFGLQGLTFVGRKLAINDNPVLKLAFFDDDNLDREEDVQDNNGVVDANDPDGTFEAGLVNLVTVGEPVQDNGVTIGGSTGVIELRNNPLLDQAEFIDELVEDVISNYRGLLFFCGNDGSDDVVDNAKRLKSFSVCPTGGG